MTHLMINPVLKLLPFMEDYIQLSYIVFKIRGAMEVHPGGVTPPGAV